MMFLCVKKQRKTGFLKTPGLVHIFSRPPLQQIRTASRLQTNQTKTVENVPKSHQLKRRDGDTDQDDVADVQGHVCRLVDSRELQACAKDAGEGEDDHEAPAGGFAETMADREEDCDGEGGEVEDEEEDGYAVSIVDCHCFFFFGFFFPQQAVEMMD